MKEILKHLRPVVPLIIASFACLFGQAMMELMLPNVMADIVDTGILKGDMAYIYAMGVRMLAYSAVMVVCAIGVSYCASRVSASVSRSLRSAVFRKVMSFSRRETGTFTTASLITRSTNDVQQVQMATVMLLRMAGFAPMMGIGACIMALRMSPGLSWTIGLALAVVVCLLLVIFFTTMPKFKIVQKMIDRLNLIMNERLTGILVIRAFNAEDDAESRFEKANSDLTNLNLFVSRVMSVMQPAMALIMSGSSLLIVWFGAKMINVGGLEVGDMLAFMQYGMHVIISFLFISVIFIMLPRAMVSMKRIEKVLETETSVKDKSDSEIEAARAAYEAGGEESRVAPGTVEFRNVAFTYPDAQENVLSDINLTIRPGETTAIIGSTGCGKTSLVNLIPRLYDVTEGSVLVDGIDVRDMKQTELRDKIGYISQKAVLFSGNIRDNLRYGREDATDEEIIHAAEVAQAMEFISQKEKGLDEPIAQGGTNVSGGQKQRLSIARALVKRPEIYIFDDSFSALDFATDAQLRAALKSEMGGATIIIVAQRINTIKNSEQIVVLDEGRIAGIGTHEELLENCGVYREIALSQLREEEL